MITQLNQHPSHKAEHYGLHVGGFIVGLLDSSRFRNAGLLFSLFDLIFINEIWN